MGVSGQGGIPRVVFLQWGGVGVGLCQGDLLPPVDRQTPVKILPCPKLRLWMVNVETKHCILKLMQA